ncbi:MAG: 16S rRNA (cytosine(1402)-N(4))-methyltransferase RsmH [Fretibacterium sp.]|nr:16S rRNA (cytosine(1402)-N(4))-methyltransferase RsmH [Fretibacterium sp.]
MAADAPYTHEPVLLEEVLSVLRAEMDGRASVRAVDGTLGLGGYSEAMLRTFPGAEVVGIDRDLEALGFAQARLEGFGSRFSAVHANFGDLRGALEGRGPFDVFVFDLGVSNMQLSEGERGFSFQKDGPLDMRMNPQGGGPTAADVLAQGDAKKLARIFWEYGEERHSRRIAACVEEHLRRGGRLETTGDLTALIRGCLPEPVQRKMGGHPARRVFQALRIFVNDELGELDSMLGQIPALTQPGGVAVIVSYHSLEDRMVKHRFRAWEKEEGLGRVLTRHPILPGEEERARNYKARSAKLRAFRFGA